MSKTAHPYAPQNLGKTEVILGEPQCDTGLRVRVPAPAIRELGSPDRVSLVKLGDEWWLRAGERSDLHYSVYHGPSSDDCRLTTRGCRAMGLSVGDVIVYHEGDPGVRLEFERGDTDA